MLSSYGQTRDFRHTRTAETKITKTIFQKKSPSSVETLEVILWNEIKPVYVLEGLGFFSWQCFYPGYLGRQRVNRFFALSVDLYVHNKD